MNLKYRIAIIRAYEHLIEHIMGEVSDNEKIIIELPDIGTVKDGGKAFFADECRKLLALMVTEYYSTENLDKWNSFKELLESRLENELNYNVEEKHTTEIISRNWATNRVLIFISHAESALEKEEKETVTSLIKHM